MTKVSNKNRKYRTLVQIFIFVLVTLISANGFLSESGRSVSFLPDASTHSICPLGGVVSLYKLMATGTLVQKIHESSLVLMIIVLIMSIVFGAVFCGWICPFGTFQEWIGKIGRKLFKKKYNNVIPQRVDRLLRYFRYAVVGWIIYVTAVTGKLVFGDIDPYYALFNFWSGEVAVQALVLLGIIAAASLIIERPWCKYACPLGALIGLTNTFRIFKIRRNESTCIGCSKCDRACPMGIKVSESKTVRNPQCISCLECTSDLSCPVANTVGLSAGGGKQYENQA